MGLIYFLLVILALGIIAFAFTVYHYSHIESE